jgi:hypothetical protein
LEGDPVASGCARRSAIGPALFVDAIEEEANV